MGSVGGTSGDLGGDVTITMDDVRGGPAGNDTSKPRWGKVLGFVRSDGTPVGDFPLDPAIHKSIAFVAWTCEGEFAADARSLLDRAGTAGGVGGAGEAGKMGEEGEGGGGELGSPGDAGGTLHQASDGRVWRYETLAIGARGTYALVAAPPGLAPVFRGEGGGGGGFNGEGEESHPIRLGLGDFIFYSMLVAQAAKEDFIALVVCFTCILVGLVSTLALLALYGKALPALPASIFLAVPFYFLADSLFLPLFKNVIVSGIAV
jgi:hypothetical protein